MFAGGSTVRMVGPSTIGTVAGPGGWVYARGEHGQNSHEVWTDPEVGTAGGTVTVGSTVDSSSEVVRQDAGLLGGWDDASAAIIVIVSLLRLFPLFTAAASHLNPMSSNNFWRDLSINPLPLVTRCLLTHLAKIGCSSSSNFTSQWPCFYWIHRERSPLFSLVDSVFWLPCCGEISFQLETDSKQHCLPFR